MHACRPGVGANVPAAHTGQPVALACADAEPAGHGFAAVADCEATKDPGGDDTQAVEAFDDAKEPAAHCVHDDAPGRPLTDPAGHAAAAVEFAEATK